MPNYTVNSGQDSAGIKKRVEKVLGSSVEISSVSPDRKRLKLTQEQAAKFNSQPLEERKRLVGGTVSQTLLD